MARLALAVVVASAVDGLFADSVAASRASHYEDVFAADAFGAVEYMVEPASDFF